MFAAAGSLPTVHMEELHPPYVTAVRMQIEGLLVTFPCDTGGGSECVRTVGAWAPVESGHLLRLRWRLLPMTGI